MDLDEVKFRLIVNAVQWCTKSGRAEKCDAQVVMQMGRMEEEDDRMSMIEPSSETRLERPK